MTTLKTASVLAFERKLDPSDALLYSGPWDKRGHPSHWAPIMVREKSVRGTISNRLKKAEREDPAKLNASIEKPNLQTVDVATLPVESDTLKVSFTLRVLGGTGKPSACNSADYQKKLLAAVASYTQVDGYTVLAHRYAHNLANARFLWRNRLGAEEIEVHIQQLIKGEPAKTWIFDALAIDLRGFKANGSVKESLQKLSELIAKGLEGKGHVLLQVTAFARMGSSQEVFPSQELILDKGSNHKSKTLYTVGGVAGIHSQKIGNALRTIDTWHSDVDELGPIAVEPYGSVTTLGKACRPPIGKLDFYSLLDDWVLKDKLPALDQQHFVMATLIRGGVFGEASKD
jgi:CRISPR-associated protein Csy3